jgi:hypothetical protein
MNTVFDTTAQLFKLVIEPEEGYVITLAAGVVPITIAWP